MLFSVKFHVAKRGVWMLLCCEDCVQEEGDDRLSPSSTIVATGARWAAGCFEVVVDESSVLLQQLLGCWRGFCFQMLLTLALKP